MNAAPATPITLAAAEAVVTGLIAAQDENYRNATLESCVVEVAADITVDPVYNDADDRAVVLCWFDPLSASELSSTGFMGAGDTVLRYEIEQQDGEPPKLLASRVFGWQNLSPMVERVSHAMFKSNFVNFCAARLLKYKQRVQQRNAALA